MKEKLLSALTALATRKHGSEDGNEMLSPFIQKAMIIEASFVSNERTFTSRYEKSYVDGQTILALLSGREHEIAILIHPDGNWKSRKPVLPLNEGDRFEIEVEILGFNSLHQRGHVRGIHSGRNEIKAKRRLWIETGRHCENSIDTATVERPKEEENRRKAGIRRKKRMKSTSQEEKSENLGCGNLPSGLPQGNTSSGSIVFFVFPWSPCGRLAIRLVANAFN